MFTRERLDGPETTGFPRIILTNKQDGLIAVCIDNDGSVVNVYNSTQAVLGESDKPRSIIPSPPEKMEAGTADIESQFHKAVSGVLGRRSVATEPLKVLAEKVGYDFSGKLGLVVRQRDVDVVIDKGLCKRYKIRIRAMR